ncbi:transposase [Corynebacterium cystitidis]|uniref:transposase n=1 Tax=Corynebacterium cystitidis TaxID=35757 RepID=UPI00211E8162|nr:transposase [Corynebacterium cystitidis]
MPRQYSEQFRQQCVDAVVVLGKTRAEVAVEYDIATSTLGRWVAQQQGTAGTGSGSHRRKADPNLDDPAEMAKRIAELERENEFLKKAAALLAKEH